MAYGELYIPPTYIANKVNPVNGQFQKGHVPHNKGKKWSEYVGKRAQKRMAKGWKNLDLNRNNGACAGWNKKAIIAVSDDGKWQYHETITIASERLGICHENISRCCRSNAARHVNKKTGNVNTDHKYYGIRFYYETDEIWMDKINLEA